MKKVTLLALLALLIPWLSGCKKSSPPEKPKQAIVYTIAGTGQADYSNSYGPFSKFNNPIDVAVHTDGTIYITDRNNYRVRKLATDGQVYPFAGSGTFGSADGNVTTASFAMIGQIALDAAGDVYFLDELNPQVRKITAGTTVSGFAGSVNGDFADGPANLARFKRSEGITIDGSGTVYVADTYNHRIRKIKNGQVSTVAGSGTAGYLDGNAAQAQFNNPKGIAIDKQGNIYVCDADNRRIRKITPAGMVTTLAGTGQVGLRNGSGDIAEFYLLGDMVIDKQGNLYVIDAYYIRKITPGGEVSLFAGDGQPGFQDGEARFAHFNLPSGLAIDADGNIYVADSGNNRVRKIIFY